jgi:hypothetical protein
MHESCARQIGIASSPYGTQSEFLGSRRGSNPPRKNFGLGKLRRVHPLRASKLLTVIACHFPPRAVATPRAFNASAMVRRDVAPDFCL